MSYKVPFKRYFFSTVFSGQKNITTTCISTMEKNLWKTSQANNNGLLDHSADETFNFMQFRLQPLRIWFITEVADESFFFSLTWILFMFCFS